MAGDLKKSYLRTVQEEADADDADHPGQHSGM